jgi:iron only hydrogenase large subunit-like protein
VVATVAPSVRVTIAEAVGLPDGAPLANMAGQLVAALHGQGFDYVFDTQLSADVTIMEEGTELLHRCARAPRLCGAAASFLGLRPAVAVRVLWQVLQSLIAFQVQLWRSLVMSRCPHLPLSCQRRPLAG